MTTHLTDVVVDCETGRKLGCATFCCKLLVRLDEDEREPSVNGLPSPGYVAKDEKGNCIHIDPETGWCTNWENRPRVCRAYDCNSDPLLQIVLRDGFCSLARLVTTPEPAGLPKVTVPYMSRKSSP
jgi:uncharacterized protein